MPCLTYRSNEEREPLQSVEGDPDCDELLQEMRAISPRWLIEVYNVRYHRGFFRKPKEVKQYRLLYAINHVEVQIINLCTEGHRGSLFYLSDHSREQVMNFIIGYLAAHHDFKTSKEGWQAA